LHAACTCAGTPWWGSAAWTVWSTMPRCSTTSTPYWRSRTSSWSSRTTRTSWPCSGWSRCDGHEHHGHILDGPGAMGAAMGAHERATDQRSHARGLALLQPHASGLQPRLEAIARSSRNNGPTCSCCPAPAPLCRAGCPAAHGAWVHHHQQRLRWAPGACCPHALPSAHNIMPCRSTPHHQRPRNQRLGLPLQHLSSNLRCCPPGCPAPLPRAVTAYQGYPELLDYATTKVGSMAAAGHVPSAGALVLRRATVVSAPGWRTTAADQHAGLRRPPQQPQHGFLSSHPIIALPGTPLTRAPSWRSQRLWHSSCWTRVRGCGAADAVASILRQGALELVREQGPAAAGCCKNALPCCGSQWPAAQLKLLETAC